MVAAIILGGWRVWKEDPLDLLCPRLLAPIANRPLLSHVVGWLKEAGVRAVTICANESLELLQRMSARDLPQELDPYCYVDLLPRGPAGCCCDAASIVSAEHYVVLEAGILPALELSAVLAAHVKSNAAATVVVNRELLVHACPETEWSPAGIYVFAWRALESVRHVGYQDIKEMLIPQLYHGGELVLTYETEHPSPRVSGLASYLGAQSWVLSNPRARRWIPRDYKRSGNVYVHRSAWVADDARLLGPVMVGPDTRVGEGAIIVGPSVIGGDCVLDDGCIIGRSVVWDHCHIGSRAQIDQCLVASGTSIDADTRSSRTVRGANVPELSEYGLKL